MKADNFIMKATCARIEWNSKVMQERRAFLPCAEKKENDGNEYAR